MSLKGHVYLVTNPTEFFASVGLGGKPPKNSYQPLPEAYLQVSFYNEKGLLIGGSPVGILTRPNGSFEIAAKRNATKVFLFVWLGFPVQTTSGATFGIPLYRSSMFSRKEAEKRELDIWVYPDALPKSDGITAGAISSLMGKYLPSTTEIHSHPSGLYISYNLSVEIAGSISAEFGVALLPNVSNDLSKLLDPQLTTWYADVTGILSWLLSWQDVGKILAVLLELADKPVNAAILANMESTLEKPVSQGGAGIPSSVAKTFLTKDVSVVFMNVSYPTQHRWTVGNTRDSKIVVTGNPCVGYPRHFGKDPLKKSKHKK